MSRTQHMQYAVGFLLGLASLTSTCDARQAAESRDGELFDAWAPASTSFAIEVRPQELSASPQWRSLPISHAGQHISRFSSLGVERILLLGLHDPTATDEKRPSLEWAVVAEFSKPVDRRRIWSSWNHAFSKLTPRTEQPEELALNGRQVFRFPSGALLPRPRRVGRLTLFDKDGTPGKGLNVGYASLLRRYISGGTRAVAEFHFNHLVPQDFNQQGLNININVDVFKTHLGESDAVPAQVILKNPQTGIKSLPIKFSVESNRPNRLSVPLQLKAFHQNKQATQINLWNDLVANEKLIIELRCLEPGQYLGIGETDVTMLTHRSDYAVVDGRRLVVAQSQLVLNRLFAESKPAAPLKRLWPIGAHSVKFAADLRTPYQRQEIRRLLNAVLVPDFYAEEMPEELSGIHVRISTGETFQATLQWECRRPEFAKTLKRTLNRQLIADWREEIRRHIREISHHSDPHGKMTSLATFGIDAALPRHQLDSPEMQNQLEAALEELISNLKVNQQGKIVEVQCAVNKLPKYKFADTLRVWIDCRRAEQLRSHQQFELAYSSWQRALQRQPNCRTLRFRIAHGLIFNISREFDAAADRYLWVKRGIELLLDAAESESLQPEDYWLIGYMLHRKLGLADERVALREQFQNDSVLTNRIARLIKKQEIRNRLDSADWRASVWGLLQSAQTLREPEERYQGIDERLKLNLFANAQARYAAALTDAGQWQAARRNWQQAAEAYQRMKEKGTARKTGDGAVPSGVETWFEDYLNFPYWITRCRFEQRPATQTLRKQWQQATAALKTDRVAARKHYQSAVRQLHELYQQSPKQLSMLAEDFLPLLQQSIELSRSSKSAIDPRAQALRHVLSSQRDAKTD